MNKTRCAIGRLLVIIYLMMMCMSSAFADTYASERFKTKSVTISSTFKVSFGATTYDTCDELGLKSYTLYTSSGTSVMSSTPETYIKGSNFKSSVELSSYVEKGKSYYITATFYADGETKSITSSTRKY